ncbi:MAG: glycoside hydrolase family protein [Crinalium sp.]
MSRRFLSLKDDPKSKLQQEIVSKSVWKIKPAGSLSAIAFLLFLLNFASGKRETPSVNSPTNAYGTQPLVLKEGDPYIRALMRTISASEANDRRPYSIIYGGDHVSDLSDHPNRCVRIFVGPNIGNCSTAAGRYQMINTTWDEKAKRYHPQPPGLMFWKSYSFEPEYQDAVVYAWLKDPQAWGVDISALLRQGKINQVLKRLSGTWTSLGYGIEDNSMTSKLPAIYKKMLREELRQAP